MHACEFEGDALVLLSDGCPPVEATRGVDHAGRDAGDLVASLLALADASAEARERGDEERGDVAGLESAFAGLLHPCPDFVEVECAEHLGVECTLGEHLVEAV